MPNSYQAPQGRLLPTLAFSLFILGLMYALFLIASQFSINRDMGKIDAQIGDLNLSIEALKADQIEEVFVSQDLSDRVNAITIQWSSVLKTLDDLTPVTVFFSSYSAGSDGEIQLSGITDSNGAVADIITDLEESASFSDVFVPSVTLGTTGDGQAVVSFSLSLKSSVK